MPTKWLTRRGELFCREWSTNFFSYCIIYNLAIEEVSAGRCDAENMGTRKGELFLQRMEYYFFFRTAAESIVYKFDHCDCTGRCDAEKNWELGRVNLLQGMEYYLIFFSNGSRVYYDYCKT